MNLQRLVLYGDYDGIVDAIRMGARPFPEMLEMVLHGELAMDARIEELIRMLIRAGADVNEFMSEPPLHIAVRVTNNSLVELLLQYGADVNATDADGQTALQHAIYQGNQHLANLLVQYGADPNSAIYMHGDNTYMRSYGVRSDVLRDIQERRRPHGPFRNWILTHQTLARQNLEDRGRLPRGSLSKYLRFGRRRRSHRRSHRRTSRKIRHPKKF